ncbi:MAG: hypothetical protein NDF55_10190 [archaeon GB-1867-005]|nr:hypothetical protein [Candidatus Culexmicrobium cathedralense]
MRRSKLEIYMDVLRIISKGCHKPTRIMYRSNLSWNPLCEVMDFLVNQGVVRVKKSGKKKEYYLTEKGREILKYYEKLKLMLMEKTEFSHG